MPVVRVRTPSRKKALSARHLAKNWAGAEADGNLDQAIVDPKKAETPLIQGQILKRGSHEDDGFLSRWVVVTPTYVSYAKFENTRVIDRIEMDEVVGIASRSDEIDEDEPLLHSDLEASRFASFDGMIPQGGVRRNAVFWRFKLELTAEKKKAFTYKLGHASFALFTSSAGFHRGRIFVFQCENTEQKEKWTETIGRTLNERLEKPLKPTSRLYNIRKRVRWFYVGDLAQIFVATLIMVRPNLLFFTMLPCLFYVCLLWMSMCLGLIYREMLFARKGQSDHSVGCAGQFRPEHLPSASRRPKRKRESNFRID